jgi:hypothetical protein
MGCEKKTCRELDELFGKLKAAATRKKHVDANGLSPNQSYFCYVQALSLFREHYGDEGMELFWVMMPEPDPEFCWEKRGKGAVTQRDARD